MWWKVLYLEVAQSQHPSGDKRVGRGASETGCLLLGKEGIDSMNEHKLVEVSSGLVLLERAGITSSHRCASS